MNEELKHKVHKIIDEHLDYHQKENDDSSNENNEFEEVKEEESHMNHSSDEKVSRQNSIQSNKDGLEKNNSSMKFANVEGDTSL